MTPRTELVVFRLDGFGGRFDGHIAGALERAESGGALRVMEALVVGRDHETGELTVLRAKGGTGGLLPALTAFRLDRGGVSGISGSTARASAAAAESAPVRQLAELLRPGIGVVAIRLEHRWAETLDDAVVRAHGQLLTDDPSEPVPTEDVAAVAFDVARRELAPAG